MEASQGWTIRQLDAEQARAAIPALAAVLRDCVDGGASVSFMAPLTVERAEQFWSGVAESVARGATALIAAARDGRILGTVQLLLALPENQPHRAEIAKLLVHRDARRQGVADALMRAAEGEAVRRRRMLLTLDTANPDAERVYQRLGWQMCGRIPDYALFPDGRYCDTVIYWKRLAESSVASGRG